MRAKGRKWAVGWLPAWVVGVWLSFLLPDPGWIYWLGAVAGLVILLILWRWYWAMLLLALGLGVLFGLWRTECVLQQQWPLVADKVSQSVRFTVVDIPQVEARKVRFLARVEGIQTGDQLWMLTDAAGRQWVPGSRWQAMVRVRAVVGEVNQVGFNREAWALSNHIVATGSIRGQRTALPARTGWYGYLAGIRMKLGEVWQKQLGTYPQGVSLLKALTVGDQGALPASAWQIFRPLGINHLISISGLHVGMLAMLAGWLCNKGLRFLPLNIHEPWRYVRFTAVMAAVVYSADRKSVV